MNAQILLSLELILHIATVIVLGSYYNPDARFKSVPSLIAAGLIATSGLLAWQIISQWPRMVEQEPRPQLTAFFLFVFLPIVWCRGDVALLLHRLREARKMASWPWK